MPLFHGRLLGPSGRIEDPERGILVGKIGNWTLTRMASEGPDSNFYRLHANLEFVSKAIFDDPSFEKRVIVTLGRGRAGRSHYLVQEPGRRTALEGRSLIMEGVLPHAIE